jgi:protein-L-isoaspartate(D-aspartate) O-methyltransferase
MSTAFALADQARFNMIEQQIRPWEVLDARVLALLDSVKRDQFVSVAHASLAYADLELPLLPHGSEDQIMLAPKVQARLVQDLALQPTDRVLEIGTGSGYTTALLASLAQHVTSLEIHPNLANIARGRLSLVGITHVDVRHADASADQFAACRQGAPWDAIVVNGSLAEVPAALLDLLADGGRLFAITGDVPMMRATFITRTGPGQFSTRQPWDTVAPRLQGFVEPSRFCF